VTRRQAALVFAATLALLVAQGVLLYGLYADQRDAVAAALEERLAALGRTAARALPEAPAPLLVALVEENRLEDALLLDRELAVVAGARTPAASRVNLLRVDGARLEAARAGRASVGRTHGALDVELVSGTFPAGGGRVLILEAGAAFLAPIADVAVPYAIAAGLSLLVAGVFSVGLWLAVRSLERARLAHGRAERLAAVGQMAAMVAHEVRNPLGVVRGQVELLRERLAPAGRDAERVEEILAEIERVNQLTHEFLTLAREAPLERAPVDVTALAEEVAGAARLAAPAATIEVEGEPVTALGDAGRLRQALLNLALNAAQVGGDGVTVRLAVARAGGAVRVTVSDDGPGVPPALAATLFEPFVSGREGGSGLGLAVAARIAERHGGRLALEPSERGARFALTIPGET
jgi:two-component system OmpR family sensor kinase